MPASRSPSPASRRRAAPAAKKSPARRSASPAPAPVVASPPKPAAVRSTRSSGPVPSAASTSMTLPSAQLHELLLVGAVASAIASAAHSQLHLKAVGDFLSKSGVEWLKLAPTLLLGVALVLSVQAAGAKASRAALAVAAYFTVTVLASSAKILKYTLPFPEVVAVLDDLALVAFVHFDAPRTKSKQLPLMTVMAAVLLLAVEGLLSKKGPAAFVMGLVNVSAPVASAMGLAALYACATAVARAALAVQERSVHAGRALGVALAVLLAMKAALVAPAVGPVLALVANDKTAKSITQWAVSYFLASSV